MKHLTLHSYLSTRCLKERSILTLSSNGHSNWKNQQLPPRISEKKNNMYSINQFPHVLFSLQMTETYMWKPELLQSHGISAMPFRRSSTIRFHQREGGGSTANIISYIDGKWWLFSLCFGWKHMKSTFGFGLPHPITSPRKMIQVCFESEWHFQKFPNNWIMLHPHQCIVKVLGESCSPANDSQHFSDVFGGFLQPDSSLPSLSSVPLGRSRQLKRRLPLGSRNEGKWGAHMVFLGP